MTLEFRNVVKQVGAETHIHETSLELWREGFNVLLGTTLSGKTTLMQLMAGLEAPTAGEVWFDGRNVTGTATRKRNVAMVHQQFINYPNMSVYENIASPLKVAGMKRAEIRRRVEEAAELMKLGPMLKRRPNELSGGQQQRTALARAIVKDSDLVLLDEPLANLDYKLREELREELPRIFAGRGSVVVYATTEPMEALLLGGHTATLHEGRVTQYGPTAEVYRRPADLLTAQVFSDPPINIAPAVKRKGRVRLAEGGEGAEGADWPAAGPIAAAPDGDYTVAIRPHHVSPRSSGEGAAEVQVAGTVLVTELSGSESVAHFRLGERAWVSQSHGVHPFRTGERHDFHFDPSRCLYFGADGRLVA